RSGLAGRQTNEFSDRYRSRMATAARSRFSKLDLQLFASYGVLWFTEKMALALLKVPDSVGLPQAERPGHRNKSYHISYRAKKLWTFNESTLAGGRQDHRSTDVGESS